jgi:hypothetical protein
MRNIAVLVGAATGGLTFLAVLSAAKARPICSKCRLLVIVVLAFYVGITGLASLIAANSFATSDPAAGILSGVLVGLFVGGLALLGIEPFVAPLLKFLGLPIEVSGIGRPGAVTNFVVSEIDTRCSDHGDALAFEVYPMRVYRRYAIKSFAQLIESRLANDRKHANSATKTRIDAEKQQLRKAHRSARALIDQARTLSRRERRKKEREAYEELVRAAYAIERVRGLVASAARPTVRPRWLRRRR